MSELLADLVGGRGDQDDALSVLDFFSPIIVQA